MSADASTPAPRVSIVMPTYKRAHLLGGAIENVLAQSFRDFELIVVDDNSPDDTPQVVARFDDPRIRYVRNDPNLRLPRALNRGFALARGQYLTWTSDDNFFADMAIARMVEVLEGGECDLVYADYYLFAEVDATGRPTDAKHDRLPTALQLDKGNHIGACFLYTRRAYEAVGDYDPELFLVEDYDYFIRIAAQFKVGHIAEPLYYFRRDDETLYLSRFAEVKASDVLVRYKNGLIDDNQLVDGMVALLARNPARLKNRTLGALHGFLKKHSYRLSQLHEKLMRESLSRQLRPHAASILAQYKAGQLSFGQARDALRTLMQGLGAIEYRTSP